MNERVRKRADAELAEAQRLLEAGETGAALKPLEQARKDFLKLEDLAGLREVRAAAESGYTRSAAEDEPAYERLLYASGQNVRFLSRRRAARAGLPWEDPHPELEQPGRPEIRAERGVSRRDVPWILIAAVAGGAVIAVIVLLFVLAVQEHKGTVVNDTGRPVLVGSCDSSCRSVRSMRLLRPGGRMSGSATDLWFLIAKPSGERIGCVHANGRTADASGAGDCPLD